LDRILFISLSVSVEFNMHSSHGWYQSDKLTLSLHSNVMILAAELVVEPIMPVFAAGIAAKISTNSARSIEHDELHERYKGLQGSGIGRAAASTVGPTVARNSPSTINYCLDLTTLVRTVNEE